MKNYNSTLRKEESHAKKAVQQIQTWMEKRYPALAASVKTRMIVECLIELTVERKHIAAQR
jgi:hypothetical protein